MISQAIFAINFIRDVILCLALVYSIAGIRHLIKKDFKTEIMKVKKPVFIILAIAIIFFTLGFLFIDPYELPNKSTFTLLNTFFFTISYASFIAALSYFWHQISKFHKIKKYDAYFFIGVAAGVFIWIHFLFETALIPEAISQPFYKQTLMMIHPLAVALIFLLTLSISPRHKDKIISTPLMYISSAIFFYFLGYMILAYSLAKEIHVYLGILQSLLFLISAFHFFIGFYIAEEKFKNTE